MNSAILKATNLSKYFGGVHAVDDFNLTLEKGKLVGLIGPNGAGKSTLFNLLSGAVKPTDGTIEIEGRLATGKRPDEFSRMGVARTFQNIRLFKGLTVMENVLAGLHQSSDTRLLHGIFGPASYRENEKQALERAGSLLQSFGLYEQRHHMAIHMSYGNQRRLEIVRALATRPKLLFLDEPAAGMNPQEGQELVGLIHKVWTEHQLTIILIEHDMDVIMRLCQQIYVLDYGKLIFHGTPEEVRESRAVREAYLGGDIDA